MSSSKITLNGYWPQYGFGTPTHIAKKGTQYTDFNTAILYINKDGINTWSQILDDTYPISGGSTTFSGGTVTGPTIFTNGLTANTIYATTYQNLPVSGLTEGNSISITGSNGNYTISFTGNTSSSFSGGTITGPTIFTNGLTANTIFATTYYNLPKDIFVTGGTYSNGTATFKNNSGGTFTVSGFSTGTTVSGLYLPLSGGTLTGGLVANSGVTASTISQTTYIDFTTGSTNPSAVGGRVFFDNTSKALSYYDIQGNNVPIAMGQQLYTRVWNATGVQIDKGKVISITGTSNGLPSAILSVNTHAITSQRPIGLAAENIPNNSEGLVLNNGILSGITLNTFANGDTLYLSDTTPGLYVNSTASLAFTARTNEIGYVLQTGSTTGKIYVNINNEDSNLSLTDIERNILEGNVISSGAYEYSGMTLGTGQTINVAKLRGWIARNTYNYATLPDVTNVYYTGGTNIPLTYLNSADATYILINSGSTLFQQTTFPTPQERRENIFIGKVVHPNRSTITSLNQTVDFDVSPMAAIRDLWTPLKLINQGVLISANGSNLSINSSSGTLWGNGIGWVTNQLNPDSISISGQSPVTFQYRTQLGIVTGGTAPYTGNTTFIDPNNYDLNGVVTAIGGGTNSSTNQRVYLFPTGLIRIQYGQQVYGTLAAAVAGSQTEQFVEYSNNRENGILIGIISVQKGILVLNNANNAVFNFVSKFGEIMGGTGGLSTTTLQQAYDNSSTPEIVINATLDGLSIKNGTGNSDATSRLLEGINASNLVTSYILADGGFSGSSFSGNSLHISGSSNPVIFKGLTANTSDSNVLSIDSNGNVHTYPISSISGGSSTSGAYLPLSGGTVTGGTIFTNGLTANTISATTYYNLPIDIRVTGGTYNGGNITFTNNTGGTFNVTGITVTSGYSSNYYGSFSNNSNLLVSGANIATVWTYDTTEISNGIQIQNNSQIRVNNTGVYEFGYSPQVEKTQGPDATITIWAAINGTPVARSSSTLKLVSNSVLTLPYVALIFQMNANDYLEFYFSSDNQHVQLTSLSGLTTPTRPNSPALIVDVKQIGNAVSNTLTGSYLPLSGGTVTGSTSFTNGLTANTISATTYQNLPIDIRVTGGTYSASSSTIIFTNNTGGTFNVTGVTSSSQFTGGTVTGATNFTNGLTANTISATTYQNLPTDIRVTGGTYTAGTSTFTNNTGGTFSVTGFSKYFVTGSTPSGVTINNGDRWFDTTNGVELVYFNDGDSSQWVQTNDSATITGDYLPLNGGTVTGATTFTAGLYSNTISATTYQNLPTDIRVTGASYNNNTFTYTNNTGGTFNVLFNTITGLTVNGNLSVTGTTSSGTISATTYQNLPTDIRVTGASYSNNTFTYTNNTGGTFNVLFNTLTGLTINGDLNVTGSTISPTHSGATFLSRGTYGSVTMNASNNAGMLVVSGSGTVGGANYVDFIRVVNTAAGATNPNKTIRVNNAGGIEFLNSAYTAQTLSLSDNGILYVGGGNITTTSSNDATKNYLSFNSNNSQIYDDGNFHIHSRGSGQAMWINSNNGSIIIGNQSPTSGGAAASSIIMGSGSTTTRAYVNIYDSKTYSIGSYGFLYTGGAGSGGGTTGTFGLYVQKRIEAEEFDATSDERLKDIKGDIELEDAIKLVNNLKPIKYTWKDRENEGIKAGYSAQQVEKAGFKHLISHIPNEDLKATTDDEGFTSPEGFQFTMNYDQVTPYHGVVIKHLLEEIEKLKNEIKDLQNKIK